MPMLVLSSVAHSHVCRFFMTSNVTFIARDQKALSRQKPSPPLVIPLPEDIFYPFTTSGSHQVTASASTMLLAVCMAMLVLLLPL